MNPFFKHLCVTFKELQSLFGHYIYNRYPVLFCIPLVTGCIAHYYSTGFGLCLYALLVFLGLKLFSRKFFGLTALGLIWSGYLAVFYPHSEIGNLIPGLTGSVISFPTQSHSTSFILRTESGNFKIRYRGEKTITPGQQLAVFGKLEKSESPRNPGGFDTQKFMRSRNLKGEFLSDSLVILTSPGIFYKIISGIRGRVSAAIDQTFNPESTPVIKAMLLGTRNAIPGQQKEQFASSGMYHLLAISGLHVGIISLIIINILKLFRAPRKIIFTVCGIVLVGYIFISGGSISVIRAAIMFTCLLPGTLLERPAQVMNNLAISCCLCLVLMPYQILSLGFQLSFLATFFLLYYADFLRRVDQFFNFKNPIMKNVLGTILVSLLLFMVTLPLLAGSLHQVAPWAVLANVPALVLTSLLVLSSCLALLVYPVSDFTAGLMGETSSLVCSLLGHTVKVTSVLPGNRQVISELNPVYTLCLFGILLMIPHMHKIKFSRLILTGFVLMAAIFYTGTGMGYLITREVKITFLDVGQGDAIMCQLPGNYNIMIDAGSGFSQSGSGKYVLMPFLKEQGIRKIDLVIITHADLDHYGGLIYLSEKIPLGKVIHSGENPGGKTFLQFENALSRKNIPVSKAFCGDTLYRYADIFLEIKSPCYSRQFPDKNNNSLVTLLHSHGKKILFTGDIERRAELWLSNRIDGPIDILKVPHHGSSTSCSRELLGVLKPGIAVISSGQNNRFGFPHKNVLENLNVYISSLYNTQNQGAITYRATRYGEEWHTMVPGS